MKCRDADFWKRMMVQEFIISAEVGFTASLHGIPKKSIQLVLGKCHLYAAFCFLANCGVRIAAWTSNRSMIGLRGSHRLFWQLMCQIGCSTTSTRLS